MEYSSFYGGRRGASFVIVKRYRVIYPDDQRIDSMIRIDLELDDFIKLIFQKCENIEYIEMEGYDDCCGFAGEFAIKNPKISKEISKKKITNALKTEADYIITTCPACVMGLTQGLITNKIFTKKSPKILNLMEFLANAKIIKS